MRTLLALLWLAKSVSAMWQAVYTPDMTTAYLELANGTLVSLNISAAVSQSQNAFFNAITIMAQPPANSSLVVDSASKLYAVGGGSASCGADPLEIYSYDSNTDLWTSFAKSSNNWALDHSTVWYDTQSDAILVYGGECQGKIMSDFRMFSLKSASFSTVSTAVSPREMVYARALRLSDTSTVVIGGKASTGWMSMGQLAFWQFGSWTFNTVANSTYIDSRDNPLLLPMWNSSTGTSSKVLVLGGTVDGRAAAPMAVSLQYNSSCGWWWQNVTTSLDSTLVWATLYESLVAANQTESSSDDQVSIYDSNAGWQKVQKVVVPSSTASASSAASSTPPKENSAEESASGSTASIAAMSTILPVVFISISALAIWWFMRRRRQRKLFLPRQGPLSPSILSISGEDYAMPEKLAIPGPQMLASKQSFSTFGSPQMEVMDPFDDRHDLGALQDRRTTLHIANPDESDDEYSPKHSRQASNTTGTGHKRTLSRRTAGPSSVYDHSSEVSDFRAF